MTSTAGFFAGPFSGFEITQESDDWPEFYDADGNPVSETLGNSLEWRRANGFNYYIRENFAGGVVYVWFNDIRWSAILNRRSISSVTNGWERDRDFPKLALDADGRVMVPQPCA